MRMPQYDCVHFAINSSAGSVEWTVTDLDKIISTNTHSTLFTTNIYPQQVAGCGTYRFAWRYQCWLKPLRCWDPWYNVWTVVPLSIATSSMFICVSSYNWYIIMMCFALGGFTANHKGSKKRSKNSEVSRSVCLDALVSQATVLPPVYSEKVLHSSCASLMSFMWFWFPLLFLCHAIRMLP